MRDFPIESSIINSIRFCIMFDIVISEKETVKNSESLLYKYTKETREKSGLSEDKLQNYIQLAYKGLRSEFRGIYDIPMIIN